MCERSSNRGPSRRDVDKETLHLDKAYYYGTTRGRSWWRRYGKDGWLARGAGELDLHETGIVFRRLLTKTRLAIPLETVEGIESGTWHAGKWAGVPVVKVFWRKDDQLLVSGFSVAKRRAEAERIIERFRQMVNVRR